MSDLQDLSNTLEKQIAARVVKLENELKKSSVRLSRILEEVSTAPKTTAVYWREVQNKINKEYDIMAKAYSDWAKAEIPAGYKSSMKAVDLKIKTSARLKGIAEANKSVTAILKNKATTQTARILYQDAVDSFLTALANGKRNMERFTRLTRQALVDQSILDTAVGEAIEAGNIKQAANKISNALYSKLATAIDEGQFVQAGKMKYTPEYYAEMVARSKFHEAQAIAAIQMAKNYNTDLVLVSDHKTNTAICLPYEGNIYSLSGGHKVYQVLDTYPPFHPNCLHLIFPQFEEALEVG